MTLTLNLPPAMEAKLIAAASASGKEVPIFVEEVVEGYLATEATSLRSILAPIHDGFQQGDLSKDEIETLFAHELKVVRSEQS